MISDPLWGASSPSLIFQWVQRTGKNGPYPRKWKEVCSLVSSNYQYSTLCKLYPVNRTVGVLKKPTDWQVITLKLGRRFQANPPRIVHRVSKITRIDKMGDEARQSKPVWSAKKTGFQRNQRIPDFRTGVITGNPNLRTKSLPPIQLRITIITLNFPHE